MSVDWGVPEGLQDASPASWSRRDEGLSALRTAAGTSGSCLEPGSSDLEGFG